MARIEYSHSGLANPEYYVPGLPVDHVAARYGIAPDEIAKLGSAENPFGASPLARQAVAEALDRLHLYPSWTAEPLREKIAATYSYGPEEVICGAGETEIISLLIRAFCEPGGKILMPGPCFPIYHLFAEAEGRVPVLAHHATDRDIDVGRRRCLRGGDRARYPHRVRDESRTAHRARG